MRVRDEGRGGDGGEDWDTRVDICGLILRAKRCVLTLQIGDVFVRSNNAVLNQTEILKII